MIIKSNFKKNVNLMNSIIPNICDSLKENSEYNYIESKVLKNINDGKIIDQPPNDSFYYVRKNGKWVEIDSKFILDDLEPSDGKRYSRKDKSWTQYILVINDEQKVVTVQDDTATIIIDDLVPDEYKDDGYEFDRVLEDSEKNGKVVVDEENGYINFEPDGKGGETGEFTYVIKKPETDDEVHVVVEVEIKRLPDIESYFFEQLSDATSYIETFTPPSLADVFKTWARFSDWTNYYPSGTTPQGEAAAWTMMSESQFKCTVNSTTLTGFISPKNYTDYIHEATVSSADSDDDLIALILAFKYESGKNKVLLAVRTGNQNQSHIPIVKSGFAIVYFDGSAHQIIKEAPSSFGAMGPWSSISPSRIYTARSGSVFTCKCSNYKSVVYNDLSFLQIDIKNYPELSWVLEASPYGYACLSQNESTFYDVVVSGGTDAKTIYSVEGNKLYKFENNKWSLETLKSVQDLYGFPRTIINPATGVSFEIRENEVVKIN